MIIGSTVSKDDGTLIQRWPVSVKIAIGRAPTEAKKYPERLFHFLLLKRGPTAAEWVVDEDLMRRIAPKCKHTKDYSVECEDCCRELKVMFLSDSSADVFPHELAYWVKSGKFCHGDGKTAERRSEDGTFVPWTPCRLAGCQDWNKGCKGSGDLRVMLPDLDFRIGRIHTSSLRSIENIFSGLLMAEQWAGRLSGVTVPLRVVKEQSHYVNDAGERKTSIIPVLSIVVNPKQLVADIKESGQLMRDARMAFKIVVDEEDEKEQGAEYSREFVRAPEAETKALPVPETKASEQAPAEQIPAKQVDDTQVENAEKLALGTVRTERLILSNVIARHKQPADKRKRKVEFRDVRAKRFDEDWRAICFDKHFFGVLDSSKGKQVELTVELTEGTSVPYWKITSVNAAWNGGAEPKAQAAENDDELEQWFAKNPSTADQPKDVRAVSAATDAPSPKVDAASLPLSTVLQDTLFKLASQFGFTPASFTSVLQLPQFGVVALSQLPASKVDDLAKYLQEHKQS
jgi:hypothetical protein